MFENIETALNRVFGPVVPAATRSSEGRIPHAGNLTDLQGRNIPIPHLKREWGRTRDIGTLPSVVGDITGTSGPRRTMFPQRKPLIQINLVDEPRRSFRSDGAILARAVDFNEQTTIALDSENRGIVSGRPRIKVRKSRDERLAQSGTSDTHLGTLDEVNKYPGRGTDVLPDRPYARDMPLSGSNSNPFFILRSIIARALGV